MSLHDEILDVGDHGADYDVILAGEIIRKQEFDYFEDREVAFRHAEIEGVDAAEVEQAENDLTRVPRVYPHIGSIPMLEINLISARSQLGELKRLQPFLHMDRYAVALGRLAPWGVPADHQKTYDWDTAMATIDLVAPADQSSVAFRLPSADYARYSLTSHQESEMPRVVSFYDSRYSRPDAFALDLPLGRSIITERDNRAEDETRAVHDSLREFEKVLIVGNRAVASFMRKSSDFYRKIIDQSHEDDALAQPAQKRLDAFESLLAYAFEKYAGRNHIWGGWKQVARELKEDSVRVSNG